MQKQLKMCGQKEKAIILIEKTLQIYIQRKYRNLQSQFTCEHILLQLY